MPFPRFKPIGLVLSIAIAFGAGEYRCPAQSEMGNSGRSGSLQLPKLCMPVSYRQVPTIVPIKTRIGMLGDRYNEVSEALLGWNETGVPLVGKFNNQWEAVPCGDDTGLFYIVPLLSRQTGWSVDRSIDVFLLGMIVVSATAGLAGLWLTARPRILAVVPMAAAAYLAYKMGDVYVVQGSVVLISIPWLLYALKAGVRSWLRFLIVFLLGISLGLAQWIRAQSGSPALVFFAILICFSLLRRSIRILLSATLLIGMSLPLLYEQFPLQERDRFLVTHTPGYQPSLSHHVFWHTAYLGLSYLTNPYVSAWRDLAAVQYVQAVDPTVIYGGEKYEALLRSRVEDIIHRDHKFIFYTVAAKAGVLACMLLLCVNIGLAAAISCPKSVGTELAFWLATAFAALSGIIAIPVPQYVLGMITMALLYWYYSMSFYVERRSAMPTKTGMSGPSTTAIAHQPSLRCCTTSARDGGRPISVVIPAYNEERNVLAVFEAVRLFLPEPEVCEIIFVDDGSSDTTAELIRSLRAQDSSVRLIRFVRNFGQQSALLAGLEAARGSAVITLDCDLQHPPELLPLMTQAWRNGAKVVQMVRTRTTGVGPFKRFTSSLFYRLLNTLSETPVVRGAADYQLLDRVVVNAVLQFKDRYPFVRGLVGWLGFPATKIEYVAPARNRGTTGYTLRKMLRLSLQAVMGLSSKPLRMSFYLGLLTAVFCLLYGAYAIGQLAAGRAVQGWTSVIVMVTFLGAIQLVSIGVVGEYLARVYDQTRGIPRYVIVEDDEVNTPRELH